MIALDHVIEIALLMLAAYLAGCGLGYGAHAVLRSFAARPRFEPGANSRLATDIRGIAVTQETGDPQQKSAARRLASAVEREESEPLHPVATASQQRPPALPAPRAGRADDLKKIKGIGAKTESALNDLGIYHLDQIAAWTPAHLDWLEGRVAVKGRIRREQWVEQATLLVTATAAA